MIHHPNEARVSPLYRALRRSAAAAGVSVTLAREHESPWATATFVGALHRVELVPEPHRAFADWLAALPDADLDMRTDVVVDLTVETPATVVALVMRIDDPR